MEHTTHWRDRMRLKAPDDLPALLLELIHWREALARIITDDSFFARLRRNGIAAENFTNVVERVKGRLTRRYLTFKVLKTLLEDVLNVDLNSPIIARCCADRNFKDNDLDTKKVMIIGLLEKYSQATFDVRILDWMRLHRADDDVVALHQAHEPFKREHSSVEEFLIGQASVGVRDVWKLIGVVGPLHQLMYDSEITPEDLITILRDDSFGAILFTLAASASEVVDPLLQEMMLPSPHFPGVLVFNPLYFTLKESGKKKKLQFSEHFHARLRVLQPDRKKPPYFSGCPLTYISKLGDSPRSAIGLLVSKCVDLAERHYVPLFKKHS